MSSIHDYRNANGGYHDFHAQVKGLAARQHREWMNHTPGRRWRCFTVRTGYFFGKEKVGSRVIAELQRRNTDWSYILNNMGLRWSWCFHAYLNDDEHAEIVKTFKAKERS